MPIGAAAYKQTLTYWPHTGQDGYGAPVFGAAVVKPCRWEDKNEEFINASGVKSLSQAIVWTYDEMDVGDWVVKGDHSAEANPTNLDAAFQIQRADEIPDLRGLNRENRHYL